MSQENLKEEEHIIHSSSSSEEKPEDASTTVTNVQSPPIIKLPVKLSPRKGGAVPKAATVDTAPKFELVCDWQCWLKPNYKIAKHGSYGTQNSRTAFQNQVRAGRPVTFWSGTTVFRSTFICIELFSSAVVRDFRPQLPAVF